MPITAAAASNARRQRGERYDLFHKQRSGQYSGRSTKFRQGQRPAPRSGGHVKMQKRVSRVGETALKMRSSFAQSARKSAEKFLDSSEGSYRSRAKNFMQNDMVQCVLIFMIVTNSVLMGIATFHFVDDDPFVKDHFELVDNILLFFFTLELALNLFAYGLYDFFQDNWLVFDFVSVVLSWIFASITYMRAFRVFRIFRAFRVFAKVESLRRIIEALCNTGDQMFSILIVLGLIYYIFAVMLTQLFADCYEEGCYDETGIDYFGRLDHTMFTMFALMTYEDWVVIVRMTMTRYGWAWLPIITFMTIASFVMLNLIVAVLCDSLAALGPSDELLEGEVLSESDHNDYYDSIDEETVSANTSQSQSAIVPHEALDKLLQSVETLNTRARNLQRKIDGEEHRQERRLLRHRIVEDEDEMDDNMKDFERDPLS